MFAACAAFQIAMGVYFMALRPPLLPEDLRFIGAGVGASGLAGPRFQCWLRMVLIVLGGQMAAVGMLTGALALHLRPRAPLGWWELGLIAAGGVLSVGTMCLANFMLKSDFRWLLIVPVVAWSAGTALAVSGGVGNGSPASARSK